jgi:hypothetical protein
MNKSLLPTLEPGLIVERYEIPPKFEPQHFKVNRLDSLNDLTADYTFFTPAVIYCMCQYLQFKRNIDPLSFFLEDPDLQKHIYKTTVLPGKILSGFTGNWQIWEQILYLVPTVKWEKCLRALERKGVFDESVKQVILFAFDIIKCPDIIAVMKGKTKSDINVWALQGLAVDYSIVLHNNGSDPLPVLDKISPDPEVKTFATALFSGNDPYIALKQAHTVETENAENKAKQLLEDSKKTWDDLTPAAQKKVTKLIKEYHNFAKESLNSIIQVASVDGDIKLD